MPVVAVVAAVALDGIAVGTVAAGGFAALSTLSAMAAIGATVSAIGAVTGDKTLSYVGMGIGLVGAVGSLAFGSDALGSVGDLFGSSGGAAGGAGEAAAAAADVTDPAASIVENATDPLAASAMGDASSAVDAAGVPTAGTGVINSATTLTGAEQASSFAPEAESTAGALDGLPDKTVTPFLQDVTGNVSNVASKFKIPDIMMQGSGILDWAKDNQFLAYGALQAGGSLISGLTNPMSPAQVAQLESQANANNAAAALANRQAANISGKMPSIAVTGKPAEASNSGLINRNPSAMQVTGAPASTQPSVGTI